MIRIFLGISIVINCVLVMSVIGIIPFLLYLSVLVNVFLAWYIKKMLTQYEQVSNDLEEMFTNMDSFIVHLESMYQLETFYGDETLKNLLQHSKEVIENLDFYRDKYSLLEEEITNTEEGNEEEESE